MCSSDLITAPDLQVFLPGGSPSLQVAALVEAAESASTEPVHADISGDDPAAIVYTSGTTGRSKGAILTHHNFAVNATNLVTCWQITGDDRYLAVLPLFHVHGLGNGVHTWLASGCRMRLAERFDASRALDLFQEFQPTDRKSTRLNSSH